MVDKKNIKKIRGAIEEFFNKMTFDVDVEIGEPKENTLPLTLRTDDPQILIGEHGKTLQELQKILGKLLRKEIGEEMFLDLDINEYKKNKINYIKDLAQTVADEVSLEKTEKILPPMPSYERRIIHLTLSERSDVLTESIGEEPDRKVVVKPRQ